jgi:hypothetical protein
MYRQLAIAILIFSTLFFISGCLTKEPDFIGYIFTKDQDSTVIVGTKDKEPPDVLIKEGSIRLAIGSKVEVRYKDDAVFDTFPSNAPSSFSEIKVKKSEKTMLKLLFEDMYKKQGHNYYPVILNVKEKSNEWVVTTKEYYNKIEGESYKKATYLIAKDSNKITVTDD